MQNAMLTECAMCRKEMSGLSDKCPSCGHPNAWIHPAIIKFNSSPQLDEHKNSRITSGRNWVKGTTRYISRMPLWQLILIWAVSVFTGFIPIACYGAYRLYRYVGNKSADEFYVEINTDQWIWQSSNDAHWHNTKSFFESSLSSVPKSSLDSKIQANTQSEPIGAVAKQSGLKKLLDDDLDHWKEIGNDAKKGPDSLIDGLNSGLSGKKVEGGWVSLRSTTKFQLIAGVLLVAILGIKGVSFVLNSDIFNSDKRECRKSINRGEYRGTGLNENESMEICLYTLKSFREKGLLRD